MELNELLLTLDRVAANLGKLEAVWLQAEPLIPDSPEHGRSPVYENLRRAWRSLVAGLSPINDFRIVDELPDADKAQGYMRNVWSAGLDGGDFLRTLAQPGLDIAEYRFRLEQARRRAVRERAEILSGVIDGRLGEIAADLPTDLKVDPLPVPDLDLGVAASASPSGGV